MLNYPIFGFYGDSGSGKTHLIVEVIKRLTGEGYKVAAIKHSDKNIDIDTKGKDTWKYRQAGANIIVLSSLNNTDIFVNKKLDIDKIVKSISEFDIFDVILVEGAKDKNIPKIKLGGGITRDNTIFNYSDDFDEVISLIKNKISKKIDKERLKIEINDKIIPLSEFPADFITNTLIGMLSSLKGVDDIKNLKITLNNY